VTLGKKGIVAERRLELRRNGRRNSVTVRLRRPQRDLLPGGDWICVVEVDGIPGRRRLVRASYGVDAVQALLLAFQLMRLELRLLKDDGFALTWLGADDLGFPRHRGKRAEFGGVAAAPCEPGTTADMSYRELVPQWSRSMNSDRPSNFRMRGRRCAPPLIRRVMRLRHVGGWAGERASRGLQAGPTCR
jgi:hypothetical protein